MENFAFVAKAVTDEVANILYSILSRPDNLLIQYQQTAKLLSALECVLTHKVKNNI